MLHASLNQTTTKQRVCFSVACKCNRSKDKHDVIQLYKMLSTSTVHAKTCPTYIRSVLPFTHPVFLPSAVWWISRVFLLINIETNHKLRLIILNACFHFVWISFSTKTHAENYLSGLPQSATTYGHSVDAVRNDIRQRHISLSKAFGQEATNSQRRATVQLTQSATTYDNFTSCSLRSLPRKPQIGRVVPPSAYGNDVPCKTWFTSQSASRGYPVDCYPHCHILACLCACQTSAPSNCLVGPWCQQIPACFTDTCLHMFPRAGRRLRDWCPARKATCSIKAIRHSTMLARTHPVILEDKRRRRNRLWRWRNHGATCSIRTATSQIVYHSDPDRNVTGQEQWITKGFYSCLAFVRMSCI